MPYSSEVLPQITTSNTTNHQINHLISNSQIVPNNNLINQSPSPFVNYSFKDAKFIPLNYLKPNERITSTHANLSITETTLPSTTQTSLSNSTLNTSQPSSTRNYHKILPKLPLSFIPNLQFMPRTVRDSIL